MNRLFKKSIVLLLGFIIAFSSLSIINADSLATKKPSLYVNNKKITATVTTTYVELKPLAKALNYTYLKAFNTIVLVNTKTLVSTEITLNKKSFKLDGKSIVIAPVIRSKNLILLPISDITKIFPEYKVKKVGTSIYVNAKPVVPTPSVTPTPTVTPVVTPVPTLTPTITPTPVADNDIYDYFYNDYKAKNKNKPAYAWGVDFSDKVDANGWAVDVPNSYGSPITPSAIKAEESFMLEKARVAGNLNNKWVYYLSSYYEVDIVLRQPSKQARAEVKRIFQKAWPTESEWQAAYYKYLQNSVRGTMLPNIKQFGIANSDYKECSVDQNGIYSVQIGNRYLQIMAAGDPRNEFTIRISKPGIVVPPITEFDNERSTGIIYIGNFDPVGTIYESGCAYPAEWDLENF